MLKSYTFWLKTTCFFQFLTAILHSLSLILKQVPANETEKQLLDLMSAYHLEMGMGFTPTMQNFMNSFSISFILFLIFGAIINLFLLSKKADLYIIKGITGISIIFYGLCFLQVLILTFLPPIVCTGLIFISLLISYFTIPKYDRF